MITLINSDHIICGRDGRDKDIKRVPEMKIKTDNSAKRQKREKGCLLT